MIFHVRQKNLMIKDVSKKSRNKAFLKYALLKFSSTAACGLKTEEKNYCEQSDLTDIFVSKLNDLIFLKNFLLLK